MPFVGCLIMSQSSSPATGRRGIYWVPVVLLATAVLLALDPFPFRSPVRVPSTVPAWATDITPVRRPDLKPDYRVGVFSYDCNDCHAIIPAPVSDGQRTVIQHKEIELEHGINTRCLNCHHPTNRDAFADNRGGEIPWDQPQHLCAKCHGPVYRDWQHGSHGRSNGYWSTARGEQTRRKCIECHDPHGPPFPVLEPAPGPHTLRMEPGQEVDHTERHNPLRLRGYTQYPDMANTLNEGH
jgi:hypothetical protein